MRRSRGTSASRWPSSLIGIQVASGAWPASHSSGSRTSSNTPPPASTWSASGRETVGTMPGILPPVTDVPMTDVSLPLAGRVIGVTAERRAEEQADLLRKRGGAVMFGPTVRTVGVEDDGGVRAATAAVIGARLDFAVAIT